MKNGINYFYRILLEILVESFLKRVLFHVLRKVWTFYTEKTINLNDYREKKEVSGSSRVYKLCINDSTMQ